MFAPAPAPLATPHPTERLPLVPVTAASIDRGSWLFTLRGCYTCHGESAEGLVGPPLAGTLLPFDAVLVQVRAPRTGRMPPFPREMLSDEAVADLYNFARSIGAR